MKVETYEIELVEQDEMQRLAAEGETATLIEELGLNGQTKLIGGTDIKPFPYRIMTAEEFKVFQLLFPIMTKLEDYSSDLIPLRVLQVAAHCKSTGFLDKGLWIMHPEDARLDPILCGKTTIPGQQWGERIYLLARWGTALKPFNQLREQAKKLWTVIRTVSLKKAAQSIAMYQTQVAEDSELYFSGKSVETSVYIH